MLMFYGTAWSLLPPVVAIVLALITKQVYVSLFVGVVIGGVMIGNFDFWGSFDAIYNNMVSNFDVAIILFLIILSMVIVLIQRSGATKAYGDWAATKLKGKRSAILATFLLGLIIFVDDGFNCLTIGSIMRPVTDKFKVSRAKLAYIIDATAAPVCIIAPISSWAAAINSYVPEGSDISGFQLFVRTIPFNLYALLTLYMVFLTTVTRTDFGLMKIHERNAENGDLYTSGGEQFIAEEEKERNTVKKGTPASISDLILPMVVLIVCAIGGMVYTGYLAGGRNIVDCFANCSSAESLVFATLVTLVFTALLYIPRKIYTVQEFMDIIPEGAKLMIPFMIILVLAWTLKGMIGELGAGEFIGSILDINGKMVVFLPVFLFLIAVFVSFSSGTSWGTFAIMVPLVVNLFNNTDLQMMTICVAAVLGGAVCGDHISPISDTTIMSSSGAQCNHLNHVRTQIQYAIPVILTCMAGYIAAGLTKNVWVSLIVGFGLESAIVYVIHVVEKRKDMADKKIA